MNNIIKRTWKQDSMVNIEDLRGMTFQEESGGHTFVISGIDADGNTISLSGTSSGTMLRPDNTDQALTCSVSGGKVYATLPAGCYDVPGRAGITIFLTSDGQKTAIYAAVVSVTRTQSGTASSGTTASVVDLVNAINAAIAGIPATDTALKAAMAPTYSTSGLYAVGSYAWYNGTLYKCTTAITTAETWTSGHWTAAALGNDVSDLKSAIGDITGNSVISFTNGKYIALTGSKADVLAQIANPTSSASYECLVASCQAGDTFTVSAEGGGSPRAWAFVQSDGTIGTQADGWVEAANTKVTNKVIVAPTSAVYLVVNNKVANTEGAVYSNELIKAKVSDIEGKISELKKTVFNGQLTCASGQNLLRYIKIPEWFDFTKPINVTVKTSKADANTTYLLSTASGSSQTGIDEEIILYNSRVSMPISSTAKYFLIYHETNTTGTDTVLDVILEQEDLFLRMEEVEENIYSVPSDIRGSYGIPSSSKYNQYIKIPDSIDRAFPVKITLTASDQTIDAMDIGTTINDTTVDFLDMAVPSRPAYGSETTLRISENAKYFWFVRGKNNTTGSRVTFYIHITQEISGLEKRVDILEGRLSTTDFAEAFTASGGGVLRGNYTLNSTINMEDGQSIIGNDLTITVGNSAKIVMANNCKIEGVAFVGSWDIDRAAAGTTCDLSANGTWGVARIKADTESGIDPKWTMAQLSDNDTVQSLIVGSYDPLIVTKKNNCFNATITNCTFKQIGKACISVVGDSTRHKGINQPQISGCYFADSLSAIIMLEDDAEFTRVFGCQIENCLMGIYVGCGNTNISTCIIKRCDCGIYLWNSHNGMHGEITSVELAHCPLNGIYINGGTSNYQNLGMLFSSVHAADAGIEGQNVWGMAFSGCRLESWFRASSGGRNTITGCILRSAYAEAYGYDPWIDWPDVKMAGNRRLPGGTDESAVESE